MEGCWPSSLVEIPEGSPMETGLYAVLNLEFNRLCFLLFDLCEKSKLTFTPIVSFLLVCCTQS
jgi:hypothetical protein